MGKYIDKDEVVAEIEKRIKKLKNLHFDTVTSYAREISCLERLLSFIDTLKVIDPYEQCVQYDSIKDAIQAHAETYSFNIESKLFNQLTKEQQELWRKEIEQACISGGESSVELARDTRYKENIEVKEIDFEKEVKSWIDENTCNGYCSASIHDTAEHFYEIGIKAMKGE